MEQTPFFITWLPIYLDYLTVEKGLAKVYLDDGINSLVLKIIPEGNLLGLSSISDENNTFQYSSMAYIDSEIKQIDIGFFKQLLGQNSAFAKEIIDIHGTNSAQINGRFFCCGDPRDSCVGYTNVYGSTARASRTGAPG